MSDHDTHPSHGGHGHDDHGGASLYFKVFIALCVLTGASFFTYSSAWPFKDTPAVGWAFMMAVSCTKAMLVMLFFMHLLWEASWKYVLTIPASIMSMFLMLSLVGDIGQRTRYYDEQRWLYAATDVLGGESPESGNAKDINGHKDHAQDGGKKTAH